MTTAGNTFELLRHIRIDGIECRCPLQVMVTPDIDANEAITKAVAGCDEPHIWEGPIAETRTSP